MQKLRGQAAHLLLAIEEGQLAVTSEVAHRRGLHVKSGAKLFQAGPILLGHGHHHALLGLAEPDLPGVQARVLEGHPLQVHLGAQGGAHFTHGRGEPAGAAVGDGVVELLVAGQQLHLQHLLLHDGVADLHGAARHLAGLVGHLHGGEGGPAQTVPPGAPAQGDHQVAGLGVGGMGPMGEHSQAAAEHQRVGRVSGPVDDGPVHRGDPHLVAVVLDARGHAVGDAAGVQQAVGQLFKGQVRRAKAEHVCSGHGPRADPHHVPHHPAHAGVGAAEWLQGRGVVVGLQLEGQVQLVVKTHDARVIHKSRMHPGARRLLRSPLDVGPQHGVHYLAALGIRGAVGADLLVGDPRPEGLVHTVLGPGLGQHLQLQVCGLALLLPVVGLDGAHLLQVQ